MRRLIPRLLTLAPALAVASLVAVAPAATAQSKQTTFTGTIADSMCGGVGHDSMRMGPTDAECTLACVEAHGATYVLENGKQVYALSDQKAPEALAGQQVVVTGVLDVKTKTIRVASIAAARLTK